MKINRNLVISIHIEINTCLRNLKKNQLSQLYCSMSLGIPILYETDIWRYLMHLYASLSLHMFKLAVFTDGKWATCIPKHMQI